MKYPSKDDFEFEPRKEDQVVVIFKPTQRHYRYLFTEDGSLDAPLVTGDDIGDYSKNEVDRLADKLVNEEVKRRRAPKRDRS